MKHLGIYCTNTIDKKQLIKRIKENTLLADFCNLTNLQGALYSSITIDTFIEKEYKHGENVITSASNTTLESMSSGQQRLALANYIFNLNCDYVILDDIQNNVDAQTLSIMHQLFEKHAETFLYIQLFSRKEDILPYISQVIEIDDSLNILNIFSQHKFLLNNTNELDVPPMHFPQLIKEIPYYNPLIKMQNISVSYDAKPVLHKINWTIKAGEFWELRGPIGSGKSTLLSMIIGDNPKAFGQNMHLFGYQKGSGESIWDIKKNIGYFYPKMMQLFHRKTSIEDMIISGFYDSIGLYVTPTTLQRKIAQDWMHSAGIDYKHNSFRKLSPGHQRIVLVIRALIKQPPLLILDEPTVSLDDHNAQLFVSLLNVIAKTKKIAILFVSHRKETHLKADYMLELKPTKQGSIAAITKM